MHFLLEAAHAYALLAPAASRSMTARARSLAKANKFEVHPSLRQKFCGNCSQILIPGANCRVRIGPWRKRRSCALKHSGAAKADRAKTSSHRRERPASTARSVSATDGKKELWASKQRQCVALSAAVPFRRRLKRLCHACAVCGHVQSAKVDATRKVSQRPDNSQGRKSSIVEEARNAKQAMKRARATVSSRDSKSKGKGKDHQGKPVPGTGLGSGLVAAQTYSASPVASASPIATVAAIPAAASVAVTATPSAASVAADTGTSAATRDPKQSSRSRHADLRTVLAPARSAGVSVPTANASAVAGRRANLRSVLAPMPDVSSAPAVAVLGDKPDSAGEQGGGKRCKRRRGSDRMGMALAGNSMGDDFVL